MSALGNQRELMNPSPPDRSLGGEWKSLKNQYPEPPPILPPATMLPASG